MYKTFFSKLNISKFTFEVRSYSELNPFLKKFNHSKLSLSNWVLF